MMPGMDGYEVRPRNPPRKHRHARPDADGARQRVGQNRGARHGADDYMTKPFSPAELMAHLRALMRRQWVGHLRERRRGRRLAQARQPRARTKRENHPSQQDGIRSGKDAHVQQGTHPPQRDDYRENLGIESNAADNNVEAYVSVSEEEASLPGIKCANRNDS